jgi:hypothetical protein
LPAPLLGQGISTSLSPPDRVIVACVVDSAASTPLASVFVRASPGYAGASTDAIGFVRLRVVGQARIDSIIVRRVGYESRTVPVAASEDSLIRIGLVRLVPVSERYTRDEHGVTWDLVDLRRQEVAIGMTRRDACPTRLRSL